MSIDVISAAAGAAVSGLPAVVAGSAVSSLRWRRRAMTDALTGVWTRKGLPRLDRKVTRHLRRGAVAVMVLDLRHFKRLNDTHGHDAGDAVLSRVAQRLADQTGVLGQPVRLGGDEFAAVVALQPCACGDRYRDQMARIYRGLTGATPAGADLVVDVDVTIGAAIAQRDSTFAGLLTAADTAMYAARRNNRPFQVVQGNLPSVSSRPVARRRDHATPDTPTSVVGVSA